MPRPLILAHRGACRRARENTVEAFVIARELGADGVELDVRRTADGALVLHHDPEADGFGLIAARTLAEVREVLPWVPTLAEAIDALDGMLVNIELKCMPWDPDPDPEHVVATDTVALVVERGLRDSVIVSSFDLGAVDVVRRLGPGLETAWLTVGQDVAEAAALTRDHGHGWLHPVRTAVVPDPAAAVKTARAAGLRLDVWTVDDPDEIAALAAAGVDAVITNVPDVALAALA